MKENYVMIAGLANYLQYLYTKELVRTCTLYSQLEKKYFISVSYGGHVNNR